MAKIYNLKIQLNEKISIPIKFTQPQNVIEWMNFSTYFITGLFFLFIFSSYIFKITNYGELNVLVFSYIFIIIMSGLQFVKYLLAGERYFPKVAYDVAILTIPPVIIASILLSNRNNIDTFGNEETWQIAPITILSGVMLAYVLALNFSNKVGEKFLEIFFDLGLMIGSIIFLLNTEFNAFGDKYWPVRFSTVLLILLPGYITKFFTDNNYAVKIRAGIISVLSIIFFYINLDDFNNELKIRKFYSEFRSEFLSAVLIYCSLILIFSIIFLVGKKFRLIKYFKDVNNRINKTIRGNIKKDMKILLRENSYLFIGFILTIFFVTGVIWLFADKYVIEFFKNIIDDWKKLGDVSGIKNIFIGQGLQLSLNQILSIFVSYGLAGLIVVFAVFGFIFGKQIYILSKIKKSFINDPRFAALLNGIVLSIWAFFFNISIIMHLVLWFSIGILMIKNREKEIVFSDSKILEFKSVKDDQTRIVLSAARYLGIILTVLGVILIINGLFNVIDKGLFY